MSAQPAIAANWYPDPSNPAQVRWWDGADWTDHVAPAQPVEAVATQVAPVFPEQQEAAERHLSAVPDPVESQVAEVAQAAVAVPVPVPVPTPGGAATTVPASQPEQTGPPPLDALDAATPAPTAAKRSFLDTSSLSSTRTRVMLGIAALATVGLIAMMLMRGGEETALVEPTGDPSVPTAVDPAAADATAPVDPAAGAVGTAEQVAGQAESQLGAAADMAVDTTMPEPAAG